MLSRIYVSIELIGIHIPVERIILVLKEFLDGSSEIEWQFAFDHVLILSYAVIITQGMV